MSRRREVDQLVKELRKKKIRVEPRSSGHWRVYGESGEYVTMSCTPSGRYAVHVIRRDLRKRLNIDI